MFKMLSPRPFAALFFAGLMALGITSASAKTTVLIVDQEKLLAETAAGKDVQRQLQAYVQGIEKQIQDAEKQVSTQLEELKKKDDKKPIDEEKIMQNARARLYAEGQKSYYGAENRARQQFFAAVRPMMLEVMTEKGGDILMDKSQALFTTDGIEITQAVILKIETKLKELEIVLVPQQDAASEEQGPAPAPKSE